MRLADAIRRLNRNSYTPTPDPAKGAAFGGGYYAGRHYLDGVVYWLIAADKAAETTLAYRTTAVADTTTTSLVDGLVNTNSINDANHPAAQYCKNYVDALGNNDYYLPSSGEHDTVYRAFKPSTTANVTTAAAGTNASAVPPTTGYAGSGVVQSTDPAFQSGGAQAFSTVLAYWASDSQSTTSTSANTKQYANGAMTAGSKTSAFLVRPVRRIAIPVRPDPDLLSAFEGGFYYGKMNYLNTLYWLVVSSGAGQSSTAVSWKTSSSSTTGTDSVFDGAANTAAMVSAGIAAHPAAQACTTYTDTNGNSDYYLPAPAEAELLYRNAKPSTDANVTDTSGVNTYSLPTGAAYTTSSPTQTTVASFQSGAANALSTDSRGIWTSRQASSTTASGVRCTTGQSISANKSISTAFVRPIRKVAVS